MSMQIRVAAAALLAVVMAGTGVTLADGTVVQFAAEMVRTAPDGQVVGGKLFVGDGRTRMEMSQQGRELVRINDQKRGLEWLLFPAEQAYVERSTPPGMAAAPSAETDPCAGNPRPGMTCRRVGIEDVNGRPAVKWEMSVTDQGQTLTAIQWRDVQRGLPVRQVFPNGQSVELKLLGSETIDGRAAEKWQMTTLVPNQAPTQSLQWYDPELKLAVREEFTGGYVGELKKVRIGPQPDELFAVPAGYTKKAPPAPGPAQPGGQ